MTETKRLIDHKNICRFIFCQLDNSFSPQKLLSVPSFCAVVSYYFFFFFFLVAYEQMKVFKVSEFLAVCDSRKPCLKL